MKFFNYYQHVLSGLNLYTSRNFKLYGFIQWKQKITQWLEKTSDNPTAIAEWESLDENNNNLGGLFIHGGGLLEKISKHYVWLARYPSGILPSENKKLLDLLRSKQESKAIGPHFDFGFKCFIHYDLTYIQDSFILWLRSISDFYQATAPDSGLSAEWLSLPSITIYSDGGTTSDPNFINQLSIAVKERFVWTGKIFNKKIFDKYKKVNKKAEELSFKRNNFLTQLQATTNEENEITIPIKINEEKKIKWEYTLCSLGAILAKEAEDTDSQNLSQYVNEKARNYIDRKGKPVTGAQLLNNYYAWRKRTGLEEMYKKCKKIKNQLEKNSKKQPTQNKL